MSPLDQAGGWERLPVALYRTTPDGRILDANREFVELLGYPSLESLTKSSAEALYEDRGDRERWRTQLEADGVVRGFEARMRRRDGSTLWVRESARIARDDELGPYYEGLIEDITEIKRAQRRVAESEASHKMLFQNAPAGLAFCELVSDVAGHPVDFVFLTVNRAFEQLTGLRHGEIAGRRASSVIDGLAVTGFVERCGQVALAGEAQRFELELPAFGREYDVSLFSPARGKFAAAFVDITQHKKAEEERARLTRAMEQSAESIVITDRDANVVYVNPAFEQVSGYTRDEVLGKNPRILKSGRQDESFYAQMWDTLARGGVWVGRMKNRRKDGTLFEEVATISPVRDASGRVVNYVAVKRDVTKETHLESQLAQAMKMEAVGRLAGGVAHDFNNLLGVVIGYGDMLLARMNADDAQRRKVQQILAAAHRGADLTRQLLAFSRMQVLEPRLIDLNAVVAGMQGMLARLIGEDIELRTRLADDLGSVKADPGQIEQVIMNLAVNARDAMPEGGRLIIETANVRLDDAYTEAGHPPAQSGPFVLLTITDTGIGMDAATQARVFEPFFTTKEVGKGTGLGLAMVYGIVKQSGGYIWLYSEPNEGTAFKIYLPRLDESAPSRAAEPREEPLGGDETVLLVEDEPSLRQMIEETLQAAGYSVLTAADGAQAVQLADAHAGPIHLMVTDVIMPTLKGPELVDVLAPSRPQMKVLFISGYSDVSVQHRLVGPGRAFLSKPFRIADLLRKVRDVTGGGGGAEPPSNDHRRASDS